MEKKQISFLCVGPQRTGTSSLDSVFRSRRDLILPFRVKETFYFDHRFSGTLEQYLRHFCLHRQTQRGPLGEFAPSYFHSTEAPLRLSSLGEKPIILVVIRNPVDQCYSLFLHHLAKGRVSSDFWKAIQQRPDILEAGKYESNVLRWESYFTDIKFLWYDELLSDPLSFYNNVCSFLSLGKFVSLPQIYEGGKPISSSTVPRYPFLAKLAARFAGELRRRKFDWLVELGKDLGGKKIYTGGGRPKPPSVEIVKFLKDWFFEDLSWIHDRFQRLPRSKFH